jgi:uncharacterized protein YkwD
MVPNYSNPLQSLYRQIASALMGIAMIFGVAAVMQTPAAAQFKFQKAQSIELEAQAVSPTQARLVWRISNPGVIAITTEIGAIRIYRAHSAAPESFDFLMSLPANATSFTDSGLKPGSTWNYRIQAQGRKPTQLSAPSNSVSVKLPAAGPDGPASQNTGNGSPNFTVADPSIDNAIKTLAAKAIGGNEIELRWGIPNLPHVAALRIFRTTADQPQNFEMVGSVGINLKSYIDRSLKPNTTYLYYVKYNKDSHGARLSNPSNTATATTFNGAQPNARAEAAKNLRPAPGQLFELPIFGIGNAAPLDALEEELLYQLNAYRASKGLGPVRPSIALSISADNYSREIAENGLSPRWDSLATQSRARIAGYAVNTKYNSVFVTTKSDPSTMLEMMKSNSNDGAIILDPAWKIVGIGRNYSERDGGWRWILDFAASFDRTIPLAGEDTDGRIDGNEKVRTRPAIDALKMNATITGYGDDGKPYSPIHCDNETKECWRDPVTDVNRSLRELSYPENLIGEWHVQYQVSSKGVVHFNDLANRFDMTNFTMTLRINEDGTWTSEGYRAFIDGSLVQTGTWKLIHDVGRNEEVVTFFRSNGAPAATIRVHAVPSALTFFAVDGGSEMQGFFKGIAGDFNKKDDPQVIFLPGRN